MKILKYRIPLNDVIVIEMPFYSKILSFQMQNSAPVIWVLTEHNSLETMKERIFFIKGTGEDFNEDDRFIKYIGTIQDPNQIHGLCLVWHLFERAGD